MRRWAVCVCTTAVLAVEAATTVGKLSLKGQGVVKIRYTTDGLTFDSHYLYGEPKFKFADYRRWMGL